MKRLPDSGLVRFPDSWVDMESDHQSYLTLLSTVGVPENLFGRYRVANAVSVRQAAGRQYACFGQSGLDDSVCIDLTSGEVAELLGETGEMRFVNTSLELFNQAVNSVLAGFPFYERDASGEQLDRVAHELGERLTAIDQPAMVPDRFWSTLVDDIAIGDFATEDLDDAVDPRPHTNRLP